MPSKRKAKPLAVTPERVETVLRLRLDGAQFHDLRGFANEVGDDADKARDGGPWNVTDADLWALVGKADDLLVARTERRRARAVAVQLARRDALYARAVNAGDYAVALGVLKDQAALLGMYPNVGELRKLIKAQDAVIRELDADHAPRQLGPAEDGSPAVGEAEGGEAVVFDQVAPQPVEAGRG